ncbi:uncharacterized protein [Dendropsophus ebraccatus]|uniref:uncharacterized protein isoform X2 n=1 Tax=Dendropsophus ebraccatus TaxID=150705 RepID=UPI00383191E6
MDETALKRGSEKINQMSDEESSAKQPKLTDGTSESNKENDTEKSQELGSDDDFEIIEPDVMLKTDEGDKMPERGDEDFVLVDATISDKWSFVMWKNVESELWVVTKSPDSWDWMKNPLKSFIFNKYKSDEKAKKFEIVGDEKYKKRVASCHCLVFCFQKLEWDSETLKEVTDLSSYYGLKKVIIVLSDQTAEMQQMTGPCDYTLLNFSQHQITWYQDNLEGYSKKIEKMKELMTGFFRTTHKVGIFSRSSESEFEWLKKLLDSEYFCDAVKNVRPCYISNRGFNQFMTNVSNCSFGILYHTKNRGRINITDVTDSLYDEELDYMSKMLDKNVIVVVDDLQDASEEEKSRIQGSQPSIQDKAKGLFLFTSEEKEVVEPLVKMRNLIHGENK